jgi:hypothetical protein
MLSIGKFCQIYVTNYFEASNLDGGGGGGGGGGVS